MSDLPLAVIVPAYDAAETLGSTLRRLPLSELPPLEVVVVDDGSRDATATVADRVLRELGVPFEVIRHDLNRGYGAAQKTGFGRSLAGNAKVHVLLHADGQYAPEEMPSLIVPLLQDRAEMSFGSRIVAGNALDQGMPVLRFVGNRALSWLENLIFGLRFVEYHCGYVAYTSEALQRIPFHSLTNQFHFDGEMLLAAGKLGLRVTEVPVSTHFGEESSSLAPVPYLIEVAQVMLRYLRHGYAFQREPSGQDTTRSCTRSE